LMRPLCVVDDRLRPLSYPQTDVFILCYSIIAPSSFDNISTKWFPEIDHHSRGTPFLLVGTKQDLRDDPGIISQLKEQGKGPVSMDMGTMKASELGATTCLECSALTQVNIVAFGSPAIPQTHPCVLQVGLKEVFDQAIQCVLRESSKSKKGKKKSKCVIL